MKKIIFVLLISCTANAEKSVNVEMGLSAAPYVFAIDDDKPFRTIGKVFLTQFAAIGSYLTVADKTDAWALSVGTNIALLCNLEGGAPCVAGLLAGSYVLYHQSHFGTKAAIGLTIGVASGSLVPGIVANF